MEKREVIEGLYQAESQEAGQMLRCYMQGQVRSALQEIVEEEITSLCGAKYHPQSKSAFSRAGSAPSKVYIQGKPEAMNRPRVRRKDADGSEAEHPLETWKAASDPQEWEDALMTAILCGVSTRDYHKLHESELRGQSRSSISRQWQRKAASLVEEMMGRDLSTEPILGLMLDGVRLAEGLHAIIALGVRLDGNKEILGFRVGAAENGELARDLVADLLNRGLHTFAGVRLLVTLDGSAALRQAVRKFFPDAVIQRCLVHKERNIKGYLPKQHWLRLSQLFKALRNAQGGEAALEARRALEAFLSDKNKAAQESLDEAGEELIAFHRLEAPATLNRTFLSTNCIENAIKNLRRHIGRVNRWRSETDHPERWLASGLKLAEIGFRKIWGYRDLSKLKTALAQKKEAA